MSTPIRKALQAAERALRSFQYGNASEEFARDMADNCAAALATSDPEGHRQATADAHADAAAKYAWVLPIVCGEDSPTASARTMLLARGLMAGMDSDALITWAMGQPQ